MHNLPELQGGHEDEDSICSEATDTGAAEYECLVPDKTEGQISVDGALGNVGV